MNNFLKQNNTITLFSEAVDISNQAKLTLAQRAVYQIIYCYCTKGKKNECSVSMDYFKQWTGLTKPGVNKSLSQLLELGLITKEKYFREDSLVPRNKYKLVETKIKTNTDLKAEIRAKQETKILEYKHKQKLKELEKQGLQPLPAGFEGKGYKGLRVAADGSKFLVPDGTSTGHNFEERYYTKEEYARIFKELHSADDINI